MKNITQKNLTPRQRKAIESLLTSGNVKEAAEKAGVKRQTVYKWFKQPKFKAALADAQRTALESLSRALVRLGDKATATLENAMGDQDAPLGAKIRAANIVLANLLRLWELVNLEQRVADLEAKLSDN